MNAKDGPEKCKLIVCTVKPVYNDPPRDPRFHGFVDKLSLFKVSFI